VTVHPIEQTPEDLSEDLGQQIGHMVRAMRSRRGMSRKILAHQSDVSERYLAQLESGTANISISLLSRVAHALGVNISTFLPREPESVFKYEPLKELVGSLGLEKQQVAFELLKDKFDKDNNAYKGIALIGLKGAGKSTLGRKLAKQFNVTFVRLDETITQISGMEMGDLISFRGQDVYRRFELDALKATIEKYDRVVLETGGSLISEKETYRLLREQYFCIWVKAIPEDHMQRVKNQGDLRPLAGTGNKQAMEDLKNILIERETDYQLANHSIMTSNRGIEDCQKELIKIARPILDIAG
jgi:XRE family aerobic/anaerobic benzoate catabolism transcriptional regulator